MTKRHILLKIEIFVIIFAVILSSVTFVMRNKYYFLKKSEPKSSLDVVFFGSSHIVNSINPMQLYNSYGFVNYNYAKHAETFLLTYESLQEILKYQSPKLVVVDLFTLPWKIVKWDNYRGRTHNVFDYISFSFDKVRNISDFFKEYSVNLNEIEFNTIYNKWELTFPLYFYHSNWNKLKKNNFFIQFL